MPKPRTKWTGLQHLGTILSHPQQYYRYKRHKDAFTRENHLPLHAHYQGETVGPLHRYPGAHGNTAREAGVIYPAVGHNTVVPGPIRTTQVYDHQAAAGVNAGRLGQHRDELVVLRNESGGAQPSVLRAAVKRGPHRDGNFPDIGRTQHTTLGGGHNVAAAALYNRNNDQMVMSSGHYQPDHSAAVKLAIAGKSTGTIDRRVTDFVDMNGHAVNVTMKQRMQVVSAWARANNL